jgi:hypothetical protein
MIPWWLWLLPLAGILFYLWRLRARPRYEMHVPYGRLWRYFEIFLDRSRAGAVMLVEREGLAGLVQLKLTEKGGSLSTVDIGIPEADWSTAAFDGIETGLSNAGFDTRVQADGGCKSVRRFLRATASGTRQQLVVEVPAGFGVLAEALEWEEDTLVTVHTETGWRSGSRRSLENEANWML